MKRDRRDIARAVRRVTREPLLSVAVLAAELGIDERSLVRWIILGRRGVHLDAVSRPGEGWLTSREAIKRFQDASDPNPAPDPPGG